MGLFEKKRDPIEERSRTLAAELAKLEAEIKTLQVTPAAPRIRSTTRPGRQTVSRDPIFEPKPRDHEAALHTEPTPEVFNDLGVKKYNLSAGFKRLQGHFRGPATSNPKLVNYLAAGSIKGLKPLRYERRVARNRFIALCAIFLFLLWGVLAVIFQSR